MRKKTSKTKPYSRFGEKAIDLSSQFAKSAKPDSEDEDYRYSFSANRYRISLLLGIFLIIYASFKMVGHSNNNQNCGIVGKISDSIKSGKQSVEVLYTIYQTGGLKARTDLKLDPDSVRKKVHIDFSKTKPWVGQKNVLACRDPVSANFQFLNTKNELENRHITFYVGDPINNNPIIANAMLQLSEDDDVVIAFEPTKTEQDQDNQERQDIEIVYFSNIKPQSHHPMRFYTASLISFGIGAEISCKSGVSLNYQIQNISKEHVEEKHSKTIELTGSSHPIILERALVGNHMGDKIRVVTKMSNLCLFRENTQHQSCDEFWQTDDSKNVPDDIVLLTIETKNSSDDQIDLTAKKVS